MYFPLIPNPADTNVLADFRFADDRAAMCTNSDFVLSSMAFREQKADIRTSPWLRVTPTLNTITEAKERVRGYAEADWAAMNSGRPQTGRLVDGELIPDIHTNPFAAATR